MTHPTTVLAFGAFDGFHEGHRKFLEEAKACGERLVVAVATDTAVTLFKKRPPRFLMQQRMAFVAASGIADEVIEGDTAQGSWGVVQRHAPDIITIGYDQQALREALEKIVVTLPFSVELKVMNRHES